MHIAIYGKLVTIFIKPVNAVLNQFEAVFNMSTVEFCIRFSNSSDK